MLWVIESFLSVLCLHFLWRSICDLDWIPALSQQSQRSLRLCYRQCHMRHTAASQTVHLQSFYTQNRHILGLWKFYQITRTKIKRKQKNKEQVCRLCEAQRWVNVPFPDSVRPCGSICSGTSCDELSSSIRWGRWRNKGSARESSRRFLSQARTCWETARWPCRWGEKKRKEASTSLSLALFLCRVMKMRTRRMGPGWTRSPPLCQRGGCRWAEPLDHPEWSSEASSHAASWGWWAPHPPCHPYDPRWSLTDWTHTPPRAEFLRRKHLWAPSAPLAYPEFPFSYLVTSQWLDPLNQRGLERERRSRCYNKLRVKVIIIQGRKRLKIAA